MKGPGTRQSPTRLRTEISATSDAVGMPGSYQTPLRGSHGLGSIKKQHGTQAQRCPGAVHCTSHSSSSPPRREAFAFRNPPRPLPCVVDQSITPSVPGMSTAKTFLREHFPGPRRRGRQALFRAVIGWGLVRTQNKECLIMASRPGSRGRSPSRQTRSRWWRETAPGECRKAGRGLQHRPGRAKYFGSPRHPSRGLFPPDEDW